MCVWLSTKNSGAKTKWLSDWLPVSLNGKIGDCHEKQRIIQEEEVLVTNRKYGQKFGKIENFEITSNQVLKLIFT